MMMTFYRLPKVVTHNNCMWTRQDYSDCNYGFNFIIYVCTYILYGPDVTVDGELSTQLSTILVVLMELNVLSYLIPSHSSN